MFELDMGAIRRTAGLSETLANPANPANTGLQAYEEVANGWLTLANSEPAISQEPPKLARLAKLAISHESAELLTARVIAAAMKACDAHDDGPAAREQMRREVLTTPPEQQAELLEHFQEQYGHVEVPHQHAANSGAMPSARTCRSCMHRLRAGTCGEPVEAGLAERFTVTWPPAGHATCCPAFQRLGADAKEAAR